MRKNVIFVLLIAIIVSAVSVVSMITDSKDQSFQAYAGSEECNAQGDFKPEPFENMLLAPMQVTDELICRNQNEDQKKIKKLSKK